MGARPNLGTPFGVDGPWFAAIVDVLHDVYDLLDARLPHPTGPQQSGDPAADGSRRAVPVSEPAPDLPPAGTAPVVEPDPDKPPAVNDTPDGEREQPPVEPPRAGKGSGADVWKAFADQHHVGYATDASRNDIIAACADAEVITR